MATSADSQRFTLFNSSPIRDMTSRAFAGEFCVNTHYFTGLLVKSRETQT
jgi:hypothetical protein